MEEETPPTDAASPAAESAPPDPASDAPAIAAALDDHPDDELDELALPASVHAPEPLTAGVSVDPTGHLQIIRHLGARGRINRYDATWDGEDGSSLPIELREGPSDHAELRNEANVLGAVGYAMLPRAYATFEADGRRYLAIDRLEGTSFEEAMHAGLEIGRAVSIVLQLVQVVRQLHRAGWALVGLTPADVVLGDPIRLSRLESATRIGDVPPHPFQIAGYSAPELAQGIPVTGKEDVYTLGAILFRALAGHPVPEAGVDLSVLSSLVTLPRAPQLLAPALAPADERIDLEGFYQQLLAFKQRLARTTVALEIGSATTIGLNPTRSTNEDSCGYLARSDSGADGAIYRAVLCVADGMGGMEAGEIASGTALAVILDGAGMRAPARAPASEPIDGDPVALVQRAATAVHAAAAGRQVGTTVTCVSVNDGELMLAHVGDTRAYLLRSGMLTQLTADHSLVAAMVASGVLTKEAARGHPDSNKVLRALGSQRELPIGYIDTLVATSGQPVLNLEVGDWLVLCTDGIWGQVTDEQIGAACQEASGPFAAASALVDLAIQSGAPDNATALVARCVAMAVR